VRKWPDSSLHAEVRELILSALQQIAQTVNAGLTMLYWHIGRRIQMDILEEDRAEYGAEISAVWLVGPSQLVGILRQS